MARNDAADMKNSVVVGCNDGRCGVVVMEIGKKGKLW
jgi:hypothetical protein